VIYMRPRSPHDTSLWYLTHCLTVSGCLVNFAMIISLHGNHSRQVDLPPGLHNMLTVIINLFLLGFAIAFGSQTVPADIGQCALKGRGYTFKSSNKDNARCSLHFLRPHYHCTLSKPKRYKQGPYVRHAAPVFFTPWGR